MPISRTCQKSEPISHNFAQVKLTDLKLFHEILPLPCPLLAPAIIRRSRCLATEEDTVRLPPDRRLCAREDGGGSSGWSAAWTYHELECDEDA